MDEEEKFFAWLDGELTADEAKAFEARVAADPDLARRAEQHRLLRARLSQAFDPVARAPVPTRISALVETDSREPIDLAEARQRREAKRRSWGPPQWSAVAATLVIGIALGTMVNRQSEAPVTVEEGKLYAAASLGRELDSELASAPSKASVRIGVTFRDQAGAICRSFNGPQTGGLACRDGVRWQVRGLFPAPAGQGGDYRMAAGSAPELAALIGATISGEPFSAVEEKSAKARGWR